MIEISEINSHVSLWFARDEKENIIIIDEVNENDVGKYNCPICSSEVIPKAIKRGSKISSHFAHVDRSKCDSETMIHWWFKHKFLSSGDTFIVKTDTERKYIVESIMIEESYKVKGGNYQPDVTVKTTSGEIIYFEMAYSNSKKVEEYLDAWIELGNIVVEVDIKKLMYNNRDSKHEFKALFYNDKCFNIKKSDVYYHTIGKHKETMVENGFDKDKRDRLKKLDWFWADINKYNLREVNIEHMFNLIDSIDNLDDRTIILKILSRAKCASLKNDYLKYKTNIVESALKTNRQYASNNIFTISLSQCEGYSMRYEDCPKLYLKENEGFRNLFAYDLFNVTLDKLWSKLDKDIITAQKNYLHKKSIKEAENNTSIKNVVKSIDELLKLKSLRYSFEFKKGLNMLSFNFYLTFQASDYVNELLKIDIPPRLWCETNEERIEAFIIPKIESYFKNFNPIKDVRKLTQVIDDVNFFLRKSKSNKKVTYTFPGKRADYIRNENYSWRVSYEVKSEDVIDLYIEKINTRSGNVEMQVNNNIESHYNINSKGVFPPFVMGDEDSSIFLFGKNGFSSDKFKNFLINLVCSYIGEDIQENCIHCSGNLTMKKGEVKFFISKDLNLPKRCGECRRRKIK